MIVDSLTHLAEYASMHPAIKYIVDFLQTHPLEAMADGRVDLNDIHGYVNVQTLSSKNEKEAVLESHRKMIDLQIPLSGDEIMGYLPLECTADADYDEVKDLAFHTERTSNWITVRKGMFALFFPQDAHAPGVTSTELKKAVFKIPV